MEGCQVDGPNGNAIFLPASGYHRDGSGLRGAGSVGNYWSSSLGTVYSFNALHLNFGSVIHDRHVNPRYYGYTVRPVRP